LFLSLQPVQAGRANLEAVLRRIDERRVGGQRSRAHAYDGQLSGLRMHHGLRDLRDERRARIAVRRGKLLLDHFQQRRGGDADIGNTRTDEHRNDQIGARLVVQIFLHFVERRLDAVEQFFQQMVVEIAERFQERLPRFVDGRSEFPIDRNLSRGAVRGDVCVPAREVDVSTELFGIADR
jgi:hypothetical protein